MLGPSIKYVTLFRPIFTPSPCHTLSHIPGPAPKKVRHTSRTPAIFNRPSTKKHGQKPSVNILSQLFARVFVRGGFVRGSFVLKVLSGVVFVRSPFCQKASVTTES